jgi:DNA polymerase III alpha subunit
MRRANPIRKHATGIYVTEIPYDALLDMANIDYSEAENRGYLKLDFLNVHVYDKIRDEKHLIELMREPNWDKLNDKVFVEQLIHLSNHYYSMQKMQEPINSIPRLAMMLAIIRPAKKHLIGLSWKEVAETVWEKNIDGYSFKKSHAISYSWLVAVHMNLLEELGHPLDKGN